MKKMSSEIKLILKTLGVVLIITVIVFFCVRHFKLSKLATATSVNQQIIIRALVEKRIISIQQPTVQTPPQAEKVEVKTPAKKEKE
jgi:hypothetical protein